jgi:hypothetical protein
MAINAPYNANHVLYRIKNLGKHYIGKYREHVKSLFDKARKLDYAIQQLNEAKMKIKEINT